ncbi:MAG: glycosyltransferase family 2 protein [Barnesiella intestinihominis]
MQPFISVIIPVYNIERYIGKCLDSIVGQTLKEIEIIVVDDGSTDDSSRIIDRYARTDSRIVAIHKTNGGVVSARNCGIAQATGKHSVCRGDVLAPEMNASEKSETTAWSSAVRIDSKREARTRFYAGYRFTRWRTRSSDGVFGLAS